MKYLVLNKNVKWDTDYIDVLYFATEGERDSYIETLHSNWKNELNNSDDIYTQLQSPSGGEIEILWEGTFDELYNKNTIVLLNDNKGMEYKFYFIEDIQPSTNNNMFTLTLSPNVFLNYINIYEYIKGMRISRGHLPLELYTNKEFDTGSYKIITKEKLEREKNNIENTPFMYVFEKTTKNEKNIPKVEYSYGANNNLLNLPYGIKIAPILPIDLNLNTNETDILDETKDFTGGVEYQFLTNEIPMEEEIELKFTVGWYARAYMVPTWGNTNCHPLTIKLSDIEDKDKYYYVGRDSTGKWDNSDITIGTKQQTGLESSSVRYKQLIKLHYTTATNTLVVTDVKYDEYIEQKNLHNYGAVKITGTYGTGDWNSDDQDTQSGFFQQGGTEWVGDQCLLKTIKTKGSAKLTWNSNSLIDYIEDENKNANIINIKVSNYNPIRLIEGYDKVDGYDSITNIEWLEDGLAQLVSINKVYSEQYNTYYFDVGIEQWNNDLDKLVGLTNKKLMIENSKIFNVEIQNMNFNGIVGFKHNTIPSPNEWEERIEWIYGENIYTDNNIWDNTKEGFSPSNDFSVYKSNNPVQSKLEPFKALANPLDYIARGKGGAYAAVSQTIGTVLSRQNMKRKPEDIKGSGSLYPDIIFNDYSTSFILIHNIPLGTDWLETITDLYRHGVTLENGIYIPNLNIVKRPNFNFIQSNNLKECWTKDINNVELELLDNIFTNGVRIWYDKDNFKKYATLMDDNSDTFSIFNEERKLKK